MPSEYPHIDVATVPELKPVVDRIRHTNTPHVIVDGNEEVATVIPGTPRAAHRGKAAPKRCRFFTTRYVLAETHALFITRRRNAPLAFAFLMELEASSTTIVPTAEADERRARAILAARQDRLYSLTDALSFAVMERLGITR